MEVKDVRRCPSPARPGSLAHGRHRHRRRGRAGLVAAVLAVVAAFGVCTSVAQAVLQEAPAGTKHTGGNQGSGSGNPDTDTSPPAKGGTPATNDTLPAGCAAYTWKTPPRIVVHQAEFASGGGGLPDAVRMNNAIGQVVQQFNETGGTTAAVSRVETSSEPFKYQKWFGDTTPTIHVGFATGAQFATYDDGNDNNDDNGERANAITSRSPFRGSDCTYREIHIVVRDMASETWNFGTPFTT